MNFADFATFVEPRPEDHERAMQNIASTHANDWIRRTVLEAATGNDAVAFLRDIHTEGCGGSGPGNRESPAYDAKYRESGVDLYVGRDPDRWRVQMWRGELHYFYLMQHCYEIAYARLTFAAAAKQIRAEHAQPTLLGALA